MTKVFTTAVVIIPPNEIWGPIQDIRKKHDRAVKRWMPHITLLYPFRAESEFNDLESPFSFVCQKFKSFNIELNNFKYFHHGKQNYTLYLDPKPDNLIKDLQSKIFHLVPDCNDVTLHKSGFVPHLSVGQIKGKDNLGVILEAFQTHWKPLKFNLDSIFFIARENMKKSEFKIKKQIYLK